MNRNPFRIPTAGAIVGTKKEALDYLGVSLPRQAASLSREWMQEALARGKIRDPEVYESA